MPTRRGSLRSRRRAATWTCSDFRRALAELPPDQREALILVGASGFSYEEAAEICDCAVGTIKSRVSRARTRLGELLGLERRRDVWGRSAGRERDHPHDRLTSANANRGACPQIRRDGFRTVGRYAEHVRLGGTARRAAASEFSSSPGFTTMNVSAPLKFGMGASPSRIEDGSLDPRPGPLHDRRDAGRRADGLRAALDGRACAHHRRRSRGGARRARRAPRLDGRGCGRPRADAVACARAETKDRVEEPPFPVLCGDTVRHLGDAIAFIVADDLNSAKSAAELIEVDYDALPADRRHRPGARPARRWSGPNAAPTSRFEFDVGDKAATDAAFAKAAQVASSRWSTTASSATTWSRAPIVAE